MSGETAAGPHGSAAPAEAGADPSMEDILASIRRILNEEDAPAVAVEPPAAGHAAGPAPVVHEADDVLQLEPEMMVPDVEGPVPSPPPILSETVHSMEALPLAAMPVPLPVPMPMPVPGSAPLAVASPAPMPVDGAAAPVAASLVAPEAAAAAAVSVGALMRTLANERSTATHRGGPTIEDLVRDEMRPLLKGWLDQHLAPMVERLVRAEIERVVSRMA